MPQYGWQRITYQFKTVILRKKMLNNCRDFVNCSFKALNDLKKNLFLN